MGALTQDVRQRRPLGLLLVLTLAAALIMLAPARPASGEQEDARGDAAVAAAGGVRLSEKPDDKPAAPPRRGRRSMSESELDEALALLAQLKPELADRLESMRAEDARAASRLIQQRFPRLRYLLRLKDADPAMYELRVEEVRLSYQSRSLAERYTEARDASDDELAGAVRDELSVLLAEQFEVRQQIRERELELLEQRIAALRDQIEARTTERADVIEQRLEELLDAASDTDAATDRAADDQ